MLLSNPATNDPRPLKEAHSLAKRGHRVTIFAWDRERATTRDSLFADGVVVKRFRLHAGHGTPVLTLPRLLLFYAWCLVQLSTSHFRVVHCHDVDTLPVGIAAKRTSLGGTKLIYDMHDLPEAFLRFFPRSQALQRFFLAVSRTVADLVIVASEGYVPFLLSSGFQRGKLAVVLNAPYLKDGRRKNKTRPGLRVLYYGGLENERGVKFLVEAASGVQGVTLTIAGRGKLEGWIRGIAKENPDVRFLGWLSISRLDSSIRDSDLIPTLYAPKTRNIRLSAPGKLLTSLSISVPALVPSGTHQAELVKKHGCGVEVVWGRVDEAREILKRLSSDGSFYDGMASSAHEAFLRALNWEAMERRLAEGYESLGNA